MLAFSLLTWHSVTGMMGACRRASCQQLPRHSVTGIAHPCRGASCQQLPRHSMTGMMGVCRGASCQQLPRHSMTGMMGACRGATCRLFNPFRAIILIRCNLEFGRDDTWPLNFLFFCFDDHRVLNSMSHVATKKGCRNFLRQPRDVDAFYLISS